MGLNGHGISIDNKPSNPGTLNAWLKANRGYTQGDDLEVSAERYPGQAARSRPLYSFSWLARHGNTVAWRLGCRTRTQPPTLPPAAITGERLAQDQRLHGILAVRWHAHSK